MVERSSAEVEDAPSDYSLAMIEVAAKQTLVLVTPPLPRYADLVAVIEEQETFLSIMVERVAALLPRMAAVAQRVAKTPLAEAQYRLRLDPGAGLQSAADHAGISRA